MIDQPDVPSIVCFGEVLWDVTPEATRPGGAPMNVAYHLHQLGIKSEIISRVGNDDAGKDLINALSETGLSPRLISVDQEHPTSRVDLQTDDRNEVRYIIREEVAWDYIPEELATTDIVERATAFVFGSLSLRNEVSRHTLLQLLKRSRVRVMDINIRPPFFSMEVIKELLYQTDILKLNKAELNRLIEDMNLSIAADEDLRVQKIQELFDIPEVLLTKGSKGAIYYNGHDRFFQHPYQIEVKDTVGSGDAFLAGFLSKRFATTEESSEAMVDYAAALGAFITTKAGACPPYSVEEFHSFIRMKKLTRY